MDDRSVAELPEQCRSWERYIGGSEVLDGARNDPGRWDAAYDLRLLEFLAALVGLYRPLRPAQALMFDPASRMFLAYPLEMMPARVRNRVMGPTEACWRKICPSLSDWPFALVRGWNRLEKAIARASDRFDAWLTRRPEEA